MSKLTEKQISGMLKKSIIQKSYDKWSEEMQSNMEETENSQSKSQKHGIKKKGKN